jgi:hypothetical protein
MNTRYIPVPGDVFRLREDGPLYIATRPFMPKLYKGCIHCIDVNHNPRIFTNELNFLRITDYDKPQSNTEEYLYPLSTE